jgi:hypothetical protein
MFVVSKGGFPTAWQKHIRKDVHKGERGGEYEGEGVFRSPFEELGI